MFTVLHSCFSLYSVDNFRYLGFVDSDRSNICGPSLSSFKVEFYTRKYKLGKRILSEGFR